jgi:hypothetical protein
MWPIASAFPYSFFSLVFFNFHFDADPLTRLTTSALVLQPPHFPMPRQLGTAHIQIPSTFP